MKRIYGFIRAPLLAKSGAGFTLVEVLLSIAAIAIISGISMPLYLSFQVKDDLDIAVVTLVASLRRSQTHSQASEGDTSWGVKIQSGDITLFKGASYSVRDTSYDEIFDVSSAIGFSGIDEIVFDKLSGEPDVIGTITLTSTTNQTATVTLNGKGMVDY